MKKIILFGALFAFLGLSAYAQEVAVQEAVTEEEMTKFAKVEVMTSDFVEGKNKELVDMITNNAVLGGGVRYNEIKAAWGDEAKMAAINVTPEEKVAYQGIIDFMTSMKQVVVEYKTGLIKNDTILGIATYNKVNKAIKEDPAAKEKMDSLINVLKVKDDGAGN
ncbi:MAG: hypothetical protein PSV36_01050 [Algoriphagus sp.]|nr:hypothetical protein [Algoriphagus sp.]